MGPGEPGLDLGIAVNGPGVIYGVIYKSAPLPSRHLVEALLVEILR